MSATYSTCNPLSVTRDWSKEGMYGQVLPCSLLYSASTSPQLQYEQQISAVPKDQADEPTHYPKDRDAQSQPHSSRLFLINFTLVIRQLGVSSPDSIPRKKAAGKVQTEIRRKSAMPEKVPLRISENRLMPCACSMATLVRLVRRARWHCAVHLCRRSDRWRAASFKAQGKPLQARQVPVSKCCNQEQWYRREAG